MRRLGRRRSPVGIWAVASLCTTLACSPHYDQALLGVSKARELNQTIPYVNVVLVAEDGKVFPKNLLTANHDYAVVWVALGKQLDLKFEDSTIKPVCERKEPAVLCWVGPLNLSINHYPYTGTLTDNSGGTHELDPRIEIVR